jgi:hypothetical protein
MTQVQHCAEQHGIRTAPVFMDFSFFSVIFGNLLYIFFDIIFSIPQQAQILYKARSHTQK